jgi:hypothetical protein
VSVRFLDSSDVHRHRSTLVRPGRMHVHTYEPTCQPAWRPTRTYALTCANIPCALTCASSSPRYISAQTPAQTSTFSFSEHVSSGVSDSETYVQRQNTQAVGPPLGTSIRRRRGQNCIKTDLVSSICLPCLMLQRKRHR